PDQGAVRERAERLARQVVPDLADPFRVADLTWSDLVADVARLADEAAAIAFGGGRRVVRVRPPGEARADAFASFLADPKGDALVVAEAGDLAKSSALRRLFEGAEVAVAIACYSDEGAGLAQLVSEVLGEAKLRAEPEAEDYLRRVLGSDRAMNRRELEKLVLYVGPGRGPVTLADAEACIGDRGEGNLDLVCDALGEGHLAALEEALRRAFLSGENAIAVLRRAMGHFQRLHLAAGLVAEGRSAESAVQALRPPLFFRRQAPFRRQLARWTPERAERALRILLDAEIDCKSTGARDEAICRQALLRIAVAARR
ncbi:MAG: DNA polymerase III subunit delta, partial [Alphaproteobacteria bacterium]|nr:DNA polymerase III subunit delta [Alphaproteobacteria bacterium]